MRLAYSTMLSWRNRELVLSSSICFAAALTTSGWQCPTKVQETKAREISYKTKCLASEEDSKARKREHKLSSFLVPHFAATFLCWDSWARSAKELKPLEFLGPIFMVPRLPDSIKVPSRHCQAGPLPWATLLMQSRYRSPFSSNIYCRWARTILMGSEAKNILQEGLEIKRGNILVCSDCSVFFLLNEGHDKWKITTTSSNWKHSLGDILKKKKIHISLEPFILILRSWHSSHFLLY